MSDAAPAAIYFQADCRQASHYWDPGSLDLIITDPPFAISGDRLDLHYNRDASQVVGGYREVSQADYPQFTLDWVEQLAMALRPGGSYYVVSGWSHLGAILSAIEQHPELESINHLIWKYNFGVHTKRKFVTSHYHILYGAKRGGERIFNRQARFGNAEVDGQGKSLQYRDLEDVWVINREFRPGERKNVNELPQALLEKMILYSSLPGQLVGDLFLGSFSTAVAARRLGRNSSGFEINPEAYQLGLQRLSQVKEGEGLAQQRSIPKDPFYRQGQSWTAKESRQLAQRYAELKREGFTDKRAFEVLGVSMGRGRFALLNQLKKLGIK